MLKLVVPAALLLVLAGCGAKNSDESAKQAAASKPVQPATAVGCLGRILPQNGTFFVAPYTAAGRTPIVDQLKIAAGDRVSRGQIIATLASRPYLEAAMREAETRVHLAEQRHNRMKAPVAPEDVAVVQAEIARVQIQKAAAQRDYDRNKPLYEKDFIPKAQLDALETRIHDADALIAQANDRIAAMSNVRPDDTAMTDAEIRIAQAELARTRQEMESGVVRAPSSARVLRIIAHPGEAIGPQGIAEFADDDQMAVIAEVYESDISRVHIGQKAVITSELLPGPLNGEVAFIGAQIEKQDPLSTEPGAPSDARIFRVRLRVPDQSVLSQRINGKVNIVINGPDSK